jgi:hypothetical protein
MVWSHCHFCVYTISVPPFVFTLLIVCKLVLIMNIADVKQQPMNPSTRYSITSTRYSITSRSKLKTVECMTKTTWHVIQLILIYIYKTGRYQRSNQNAVHQRNTDNTMVKWQRTRRRLLIYTIHTKNWATRTSQNMIVNSGRVNRL